MKRNLYILKFEESIDPSVWFSKNSDKLTLQEIRNFTHFAVRADFKIILVTYNEPTWTSPHDGTDFINIDDFKTLNFTDDDVVIFWTGYNHSNRESSAKAGLQWYQAMVSVTKKDCQDYVLCTDTRCVMMKPKFFLDNPVYKPHFQGHMDELDSLKHYPIIYLTQAADTNKYLEVIGRIKNAHTYASATHLPLHLLPIVSHNIPQVNTSPNDNYLYYGNSVTDFRSDNYRVQNLVKYFPVKCLNKAKLILNNISGYIPKSMKNVEFSDRVPYSEIPKILNNTLVSVCLSEDDYQECKLIPNRVIEGISANTFIAVHSELLNGVDIGLNPDQIFSTREELSKIINRCFYSSTFRNNIIHDNRKLLQTTLNPDILVNALKTI